MGQPGPAPHRSRHREHSGGPPDVQDCTELHRDTQCWHPVCPGSKSPNAKKKENGISSKNHRSIKAGKDLRITESNHPPPPCPLTQFLAVSHVTVKNLKSLLPNVMLREDGPFSANIHGALNKQLREQQEVHSHGCPTKPPHNCFLFRKSSTFCWGTISTKEMPRLTKRRADSM